MEQIPLRNDQQQGHRRLLQQDLPQHEHDPSQQSRKLLQGIAQEQKETEGQIGTNPPPSPSPPKLPPLGFLPQN